MKQRIKTRENIEHLDQNRVTLLCIFISSFLFIIIPTVQIIASSPGEFENRGTLIGTLFLVLLISFLILRFIIITLTGRKKNLFAIFSFFSCVYLLINFFVLEGNYGIMDFFIFHRPESLEVSLHQKLLDLAVLIILLFFANFFLTRTPIRILYISLFFVSVVLVFSALTSLTVIYNYSKDPIELNHDQLSLGNIEPKFHFSKSGTNVLIIFFDRFLGGFVPDILTDAPNLRKELAGFIWYPNTLSPGTGTPVGLPAIYGGYDFCDVAAMQKSKYDWPNGWRSPGDLQMQNRFIESTSFMIKKFTNSGYRSFINDPTFLRPQLINDLDVNSHSERLIGKYNNLFFPEVMETLINDKANPLLLIEQYLLPFSLFKIAPPSLRKYIYNNGKWGNAGELGSDRHWTRKYIDNLSLALAWPLVSTVTENARGSYMFSTNIMTHDSYAALDNGKFQTVVPTNKNHDQAWKKLFNSKMIPKKDVLRFKSRFTAVHFYSAKEALIRTAAWLEWMRANNVYDNTKIIIVSDHGQTWLHDPMFKKRNNDDDIWYPAYHALLLTKDFNAKGDLKVDNTFMTNADVPSFALGAIEPDAKIKYSFNKKVEGFRLYTEVGSLIVKDNIFKLSNWDYKP